MPRLPGLKPSRLYREPATLRRHPVRVFDPETYLETDASKAATPTDTAIVASFHPTKDGDWDSLEHEGLRRSETRMITTKTRLYPTISDTNQGLANPQEPRQADQIIHDGRLWNVAEVKVTGAPHHLFNALLVLAPTEDAI